MKSPVQPPNDTRLWRDLADLAGAELQIVHQGDPREESPLDPALVGRREFLEMVGVGGAVLGLSGCNTGQPPETIAPYVKAPEQIVPGRPLFFASAYSYAGRTTGILVESHMGRPTKIEGNPAHPASLGGTDAITQASVISLYDPDRSQAVRHLGEISTWDDFLVDLRSALQDQESRQGAGLRLLTESVNSPTLARQIDDLLKRFPKATWHQYDPTHGDAAVVASQKLFGRALAPVYHFDKADVVVSLDCDFLSSLDGSVRYCRDFMSRRDLLIAPTMNRLFAADCSVSTTGSAADHRLPVAPSQLRGVAQELAKQLKLAGSEGATATLSDAAKKWVAAAAADLNANRGKCVVLAGDRQPWEVHAIAALLNKELGAVGTTVEYIEPVEHNPVDHTASLKNLARAIEEKQVDILLILDGNPAYTAPVDLAFGDKIRSITRLVARMGAYEDETSSLCHWHIPQTHYLESWSDVRAFDGTATVTQPLIAPLFDGRSPHEFISAVAEASPVKACDAVRKTWEATLLKTGDADWRKAVHDGVIADSKSAAVMAEITAPEGLWSAAPAAPAGQLEFVFEPDSSVWDGRFANNGWLQELPKTWTRLTWTNAALLAPSTAEELGLEDGDVVVLTIGDRTVEGPVWTAPGHPLKTVTVTLGHGRTIGGKVAVARGFNANAIRSTEFPSIAPSGSIKANGQWKRLACTQSHAKLEGRDESIFRRLTLEDFTHPAKEDDHAHGEEHDKHATMYPDYEYPERAWGMAIDLTRCIGCNACVVACQVENNVPVVGERGVQIGREMHWLRVDRYFAGDAENPEVLQQPMMCQHCEHAPCEHVCPVEATSHSSEGLNEMTYNRCVGTRYCSNNCPYKVRRFNFLRYTEDDSPLAMLRANPDVTVRTRGVMEKCTYCVQRINSARIDASIHAAHTGEPMKIADGTIVTACQAVCPAKAIAFGDIADPNSVVSQWRKQTHSFGVLADDLGTRPRTTYLSRVSNPSPNAATPQAAPAEAVRTNGAKS
jgi:Fe-S-cluster-containing dehydrogenase component